jgi:hypothetical protein
MGTPPLEWGARPVLCDGIYFLAVMMPGVILLEVTPPPLSGVRPII